MSRDLNRNGTATQNGSTTIATAPKSDIPVEKGSYVSFKTANDVILHGTIERVAQHSLLFELYGPQVVLKNSEVLNEFKIILHGHIVYTGHAVIHSLVESGIKSVCEVLLNDSQWFKADAMLVEKRGEQIVNEFRLFLNEWQKYYNISPEFKVAVADMQTFLQDLKIWLDKIELLIASIESPNAHAIEQQTLQHLSGPIMGSLIALFERFESLFPRISKASLPAHGLFAKRLLHPLVLCAPFMHRTYEKPLGYAGDYGMVRMMTESPFQGATLYAKLLNSFFLNTPPVVAHRNRIDTLVKTLQAVSYQASQKGQRTQIFNLGCGPAVEIQRFLSESAQSNGTDFTLLDFNNETVKYTQQTLDQLKATNQRRTNISVFKKSVAQLIKDYSKFTKANYDFVYCAGLFDYLPDSVCTTLFEVFYKLTAPGGKILVSNVDICNPSRGWMECVVDWYLIYRDANQMRKIIPSKIPRHQIHIYSEPSSVNVFAEIHKPTNG